VGTCLAKGTGNNGHKNAAKTEQCFSNVTCFRKLGTVMSNAIWRALLCLAFVLAIELPAAAAKRHRPQGLHNTSTSRSFVPRPRRSIPRAAPRSRSNPAEPGGPAARVRSQGSSAGTGPASRPHFPAAQTLEGAIPRVTASPSDFPPVQTLEEKAGVNGER
jgi:hypothetical protein